MKRKAIPLILAAAIAVSAAACSETKENKTESTGTSISTASDISNASADTSQKEVTNIGESFDYLGIGLPENQVWKGLKSNVTTNGGYYGYQEERGILYGDLVSYFVSDEELQLIKDRKNVRTAAQAQTVPKYLFRVMIYKKGKAPADTEILKELSAASIENIGEDEDRTYYFCSYDFDSSGLSEASSEKFKKLYDEVANIKKDIKIFKPDEAAVEKKKTELEEFQKQAEKDLRELDEKEAASKDTLKKIENITFRTKDVYGKAITSDIFGKNKLTMINIWATFCGPCIEEMPDIQKLSEEMKDKGVGVLGLVGDTVDEKFQEDKTNIELSIKILEKTGVKYPNLITNEELSKLIPVAAYPTTLFVDSKGDVIGEVVVGSKGKDEYKKLIMKALEGIK